MMRVRDLWQSVSKRTVAVCSAAAMLATMGIAGTALAATPLHAGDGSAPSGSRSAAAPYALGDHTVQGVSPNGTTINAFDYWLDGQDASDINDPADWSSIGINADQQLKFYSRQGDLQDFNTWTGSTAPRTGMVKKTLQNGYPELQAGNLGIDGDESLSYLFDDTPHAGKAAYMNTQGLLQVDDSGYYYYNANRDAASDGTFQSANYATLDTGGSTQPGTYQWTLYDTWGVRASDAVRDSQNGQFFPFNDASNVLQEDQYGNLSASQTTSVSAGMNHHFGLSMASRFVQPNGGRIEKTGEDMQYHFSGDDDVWVYVDGVLVGDLGGIHIASSLDINFRTGGVSVNGRQINTLRGLYRDAGMESAARWSGDTFADGTYHTLNFFYLERGGSDSNMSLKFNLKTIPESSIHKVDQDNEPVRGAQFTLYTVDADYSSGKQEVGSGTTDQNGLLVLQDNDRKVVSFDDLHTKGYDHYILEETQTPVGYRKAATGMHLRYVPDNSSTTGTRSGVVLSVTDPADPGSLWNTGSLALSKVTTTASTTIKDEDGRTVDPADGLMFAVVLKRDMGKAIDATDAWHGVSGDQLHGWKYETVTGIQGVVEAIKKNGGANVFSLTTSGGYEVTVDNLPGDIERYYYMLPDEQKGDAEYTVAYYYARGAKTVDDVTANNTVRLDFNDASAPFVRQFSANFYVSDVKNELFVQKVDAAGKALGGGEFSLYRMGDSVSGNGVTCDSLPGGAPYDTVSTIATPGDAASLRINGTATFPSAGHVLQSGTYCLVETKAPAGYLKSDVTSKVVVNDYGVFVDAGTENDGLKVLRGAGWLVRPMSSFATNDDVDNTLTWIKSASGSVTGFDGTSGAPNVAASAVAHASRVSDGEVTIGKNAAKDSLRLKYDVGDDKGDIAPVLTYGYSPREPGGDTMFAFDTGVGIISSTQDAANTNDGDYNANAARTGLLAGKSDDKVAGTDKNLKDDVRLSNVITGSVMAQFTDVKATTLNISKTVSGVGANPDENADFTFTVTFKDGEGESAENLTGTFPYAVHMLNGDGSVGDNVAGAAGTLVLDAGVGTLTLKKDQVAVIADLPEGTHYQVEEKADAQQRFHQTSSEGDAGVTSAKADKQAWARFVNGYGQPATAAFHVRKTVKGTDWTQPDGKNFTFELRLAGGLQPGDVTYRNGGSAVTMGADSVLTASTSGRIGKNTTTDPLGFAELTFTKEGTYTFTITERQDDTTRGWAYDTSAYTAVVDVKPATAPATGLTATVTYRNDDGEALAGGDVPTFVNSFVAVSTLPMTGGSTMRDWLVGAGVFAALAAAAGVVEWRRRKGLAL